MSEERKIPRQSDMLEAFCKMTPEQREYVYLHVRDRIPGVDIAYRAAKNVEKFGNMAKESVRNH